MLLIRTVVVRSHLLIVKVIGQVVRLHNLILQNVWFITFCLVQQSSVLNKIKISCTLNVIYTFELLTYKCTLATILSLFRKIRSCNEIGIDCIKLTRQYHLFALHCVFVHMVDDSIFCGNTQMHWNISWRYVSHQQTLSQFCLFIYRLKNETHIVSWYQNDIYLWIYDFHLIKFKIKTNKNRFKNVHKQALAWTILVHRETTNSVVK